MVTSQAGINLIKSFEGVRLMSYRDAVGVWTIGYGHTKGVKGGQLISMEQAEAYLRSDLSTSEKAVMAYDSIYHWTQNEFDALVSFAFNLGPGSIKQVTDSGKRTKAQISQKIIAYNKAGGRVLEGLARRRRAEQKMFGNGSTTAPTTTTKKKEIPKMPTVRFGSEGTAVKMWQVIVGVTPDGLFGGKTQAATKTWQKAHHLVDDGIVGNNTWTAAIKEL